MKNTIIIFSLLFSLSACATEPKNNESTTQQVSPDEFVVVEIVKYKFVPEVVTIKKGQKIRWINKEKRQYHNVWFKESGAEEPDYLFPDDTFEKSFDDVGEFNYICGPHPEMTGKVIVE